MSIVVDIKYMFYILFHPFDGFYEAKFRGKGNYLLSMIMILIYGINGIVGYQYTGFILNYNPLHNMNSVMIFITTLFPVLLFILSNWSVTTLFDGKGSIKDITLVMGYALVPKVICDLIGILASNIVILEEAPLLSAFTAIGMIWFLFITFSGLCIIHEYGVLTNIWTLVVTFFVAVIIIFLIMLYSVLMGKVIGFVATIFDEMVKRWWLK